MNTPRRLPNRPYIICHMISSLDGRLLVDQWSEHIDGSGYSLITDTYESTADRLEMDAFVIGRASMAEFDDVRSGDAQLGAVQQRPSHRVAGSNQPWAVVLDPSAKLRYAGPEVDGAPVLCLLSDAVTDQYLQTLREQGISYAFAGPDGHDLNQALATLANDFDINRLLLEGGGVTNGHFLNAGVIDEVSLLIYPGIDGRSGNPAIFEAQDPGSAGLSRARWRHLATETLAHGFVWLRYAMKESNEGAPLRAS